MIRILGILLLFSTASLAQPYVSQQGRFQVDQIKGCAPLTINVGIIPPVTCASGCDISFDGVTFQTFVSTHTYTSPGTYTLRLLVNTLGFDEITITVVSNIQPAAEVSLCSGNKTQVKVSDTNYNQYVINYGDGSPDVVKPSGSLATDVHSFASAGSKTISIRGRNLSAADNCAASVFSVSVLNALPVAPLNTVEVVNPTDVDLAFTSSNNIQYRIEIRQNSNPAFQFLRTVSNSSAETITSLKTDQNFYCFRVGTFDPCITSTAYSTTLCTSVPAVAAQNGFNKLSWKTDATGITGYTISRTPTPNFTAGASATSFDDTNVTCGINYCYQLISNYGGGRQSISNIVCATAISVTTPPALADVSVATTGTGHELTWEPGVQASVYQVFRIQADGTLLLGETNLTNFSDEFTGTACYRINYKDQCNNISLPGQQVCPLQLSATLNADNSVNLNWAAYIGWSAGVSAYTIEKYTADGVLLGTIPAGLALTFLDDQNDLINQVQVYRIIATPVNGSLLPLSSNEVIVTKRPNLFYPGSFTPNGDLLNDTFKVFGRYTSKVEFKIFNRWGELLFSTEDISQSWDGTFKGEKMPEGTYVFRAILTDQTGKTYERAGTIVLLKK